MHLALMVLSTIVCDFSDGLDVVVVLNFQWDFAQRQSRSIIASWNVNGLFNLLGKGVPASHATCEICCSVVLDY